MKEGVKRDAYESGCNGLIGGWACVKKTGKKVHASNICKKDGPFICPACLSDVIHRHCTEKRDHFAHHARLSPIIKATESHIHRLCKTEIYNALQERFPQYKWVCDDVRIPENKETRLPALQPDIGGRIDDKRIVIEIQNSALTIPRLLKRSLGYSGRDISILWVVPLTEPIGSDIFRPRLFERYLHSIYYGRVYYWLPEYGSHVLPVHFAIAYREIPWRDWYKEGEYHEAGGYKRPYKRIRKPQPLEPISIAEAFYHKHRPEHRPWNELKNVPAIKLFMDNKPIWWNPNERYILDHYYPDQGPFKI